MEINLNKEFIDAIAEKFGMFIDWSAENVVPQVTDILMRYRMYEITRLSLITFLLFIVFSICVGVLIAARVETKRINKITRNENWSYYDGTFFEYKLDLTYDEEHKNYKVISSKICDIKTFGYVCIVIIGIILMFLIAFGFEPVFNLTKWIFIPEIQFYSLIMGA